jgi:poly-gamma-glutamate capsule biosynthesis protein CapA/YwtB (metallophosphatase superfamily)
MSVIRIGFTGDFCPMGRMEKSFLEGNWAEKIGAVKSFFDDNDFNVIDLECPLTEPKNGISKTGPHINGLPETAKVFPFLNCDVVATANNHFKDYDWVGMKETYTSLQANGVQWFGSGSNLEEAQKPYIRICRGKKIALLNMADFEWTIAKSRVPGCNPIDLTYALKAIQQLKEDGVDIIIVVLHGGHEHYALPSPRMKSQFRFMIDAGADAVVGHHTHVISGFEMYKDKPIFYSLGNFCFDWPGLTSGTWTKGLLLRLLIKENNEIGFEYEFIIQNDEQIGVRFANHSQRAELDSEIIRLSNIILDDTSLVEQFENYCNTWTKIMLTRIQPYRSKVLVALHKRGFLPDLIGKKKRQMFQILAQCETHREVLVAALEKK